MKNLFEYILFRVFEYLQLKDKNFAIVNTINFIVILQAAVLFFVFIIVQALLNFTLDSYDINDRTLLIVVLSFGVMSIIVNTYFIKPILRGEKLLILQKKFHKKKYKFNIWVIFLFPVFCVFVLPIIIGLLKGTLNFPLFN